MPETGPIVSFVDRNGRHIFLTPDGKLHRTNPNTAALTDAQARQYQDILPENVNEDLGFKTKKAPKKKF